MNPINGVGENAFPASDTPDELPIVHGQAAERGFRHAALAHRSTSANVARNIGMPKASAQRMMEGGH